VEAAIYQPLASAGGEFVSDVLKATGNEALVQAALATALTPEQAERLKTMSNDPEVAKTLAEIQDKLSVAVAQSIDTAKQTVAPQLEKVSGDVVNGVVVSIMNAISDIPGVGFLLSLLGMVDTGIKALGQARTIQNSLINAAAPVAAVLSNVDELTNIVNTAAAPGQEVERQSNVTPPTEATVVVPQSVTPPSVTPPSVTPPSVTPPSVTPPSVSPQSVTPPNEATVVAPPSVNEAPPSVNVAPQSVNEAPQSVSKAPQSVSVTPPSVNVAPPSVNVAPPSVNVAPPSVAPRSVPLNYNRQIYGPHQNDYPQGDEGYAAFQKDSNAFQEDKQKKRAAIAAATKATSPLLMKTGHDVDPQLINPKNQGITVGHSGGSRKRRRIHKLSRRIERTLRRVQKKYGFKDKGDKGDFLRRTLKHHKHKP
jgi:hypothetical protein